MQRRIGALRPLLRGLVLAVIVLAGADLLVLALKPWPSVRLPPWLGSGHFSAAVSVVLLAIVLVLAYRLARALRTAQAAAHLQQQALDALQAAIALFDSGGRIVCCNEHGSLRWPRSSP